MLIAKIPEAPIAVWVRARLSAQNRTRGGSRETEVNELTVIAWGSPPWLVVTTVTPVANWPSTLRNSAASKDMYSSLAAFAAGEIVCVIVSAAEIALRR